MEVAFALVSLVVGAVWRRTRRNWREGASAGSFAESCLGSPIKPLKRGGHRPGNTRVARLASDAFAVAPKGTTCQYGMQDLGRSKGALYGFLGLHLRVRTSLTGSYGWRMATTG